MKRILFNVNKIDLPSRFLIVGKTRSGKSFYLKYLLYVLLKSLKTRPLIMVYSMTKFNGFWQKITPFVFSEWNNGFYVKKILNLVKSNPDIKKNFFIIFDDFIENPEVQIDGKGDKLINKLFAMGRHFGISVFISSQKLTSVNTMIRSNCDFIITFKLFNGTARKILFEEYGGIMEKKDFFKMLDSNTNLLIDKEGNKRPSVMIIDNTSLSSDPEDVYFKDYAVEVPDIINTYTEQNDIIELDSSEEF